MPVRRQWSFSVPEDVELEWDEVNIRRIELDLDTEELIRQGLVYTGLIVDARGLGLQRGMSPKVYSESGQLIYAGVTAPQKFIQEAGLPLTARSLRRNCCGAFSRGKTPLRSHP